MATLTDAQTETLVNAAIDARSRAYAPYSNFATGAAVLTSSGAVHAGAMVENLVFGLAMCAERVALFSAITAREGMPVAIAVVAPRTAGQRTFPCGPCLQVAVEVAGPQMAVLAIDAADASYEVSTIRDLAPGIPHRRTPGANLL